MLPWFRRDEWDGWALLALAVSVRVLVLVLAPFDGLYGQDAYAYYDHAVALRAALFAGAAVPAFFWPAGYPLHVVLASLFVGMRPLAGQVPSLLAGCVLAVLTWGVVRAVRPQARAGAWLAGALVAVSGQALLSSVASMADAVAVAWATGSAWLVLRYVRAPRAGTLVAAAACLGVATLARWNMGLVAVPWGLAVVVAWRAHSLARARALAHGAGAVLVGGALIAAQVLSGAGLGLFGVYTWNPANAFLTEVVNTDGVLRYAWPTGVFYAQALVHPSYLFPLLTPFALLGAWELLRRGTAYTGAARVLLLGWPLMLYVFLAGVTWQNPRFAFSFFPALAVWVGLGYTAACVRAPRWTRAWQALAVLGVCASAVWGQRVVLNFVAENKTDALAQTRYLSEHTPADARVLTFNLTQTVRHYSAVTALELYYETPESLRVRVCADAPPLYVYVDEASIAGQWSALAPGIAYRWLQSEAGLTVIGTYDGWTLARVGRGGCA